MGTVDEASRLPDRVRDLEVQMWGVKGDNGLRSEVRQLRAMLEKLPEKFRKELDEALDHIEGRADQSKSQRLVIIVCAVTVLATFASSIIQAIATLLGGH